MPDETISKHFSTNSILYFGPVKYHRDKREVVINGETVRIEPKSAAALDVLITHHNNVVTREELLDNVWGESGSDEALTQAISRLRRLFGDAITIKTVPKIGYQLVTLPGTEELIDTSVTQSVQSRPGMKPLIDTPMKGFVAGFGLATLIAFFIFLLLMEVQIQVEEKLEPDGKVSTKTLIEKS